MRDDKRCLRSRRLSFLCGVGRDDWLRSALCALLCCRLLHGWGTRAAGGAPDPSQHRALRPERARASCQSVWWTKEMLVARSGSAHRVRRARPRARPCPSPWPREERAAEPSSSSKEGAAHSARAHSSEPPRTQCRALHAGLPRVESPRSRQHDSAPMASSSSSQQHDASPRTAPTAATTLLGARGSSRRSAFPWSPAPLRSAQADG